MAASGSSSPNAFGLTLFRFLNSAAPDRDVAISPLSLKACLDLVTRGATKGSECERELLDVLGDPAPVAKFKAMDTATSAWVLRDIMPDYVKVAERCHGAEILKLSSADPTPINAWVEKRTNGRIGELFKSLNPNVVMVLVNTVFFKSSWLQRFDPSMTQSIVFKPFAGGELPCSLMCRDGKMLYAEVGGFQAVRLAYEAHGMSATILLPFGEGPEAMARALASLTPEFWERTLPHTLSHSHVQLHLPRFRIAFGDGEPWPAYLHQQGLRAMFDMGTPNKFLRMTTNPHVTVGQVAHQVTIDVDEEGTVASAATGVEMKGRCAPPPPARMRVDRPFLFVIGDDSSGAVAFVAKVTKVEPSGAPAPPPRGKGLAQPTPPKGGAISCPRRLWGQPVQPDLDAVLADPANRTCADCDAKAPRWASVNLGILVCIDCSGAHRNLGTHISVVKSVTLDKWQSKWVDTVAKIGNKASNGFFEARLFSTDKPREGDSLERKIAFIRKKYGKMMYTFRNKPSPAELLQQEGRPDAFPPPPANSGAPPAQAKAPAPAPAPPMADLLGGLLDCPAPAPAPAFAPALAPAQDLCSLQFGHAPAAAAQAATPAPLPDVFAAQAAAAALAPAAAPMQAAQQRPAQLADQKVDAIQKVLSSLYPQPAQPQANRFDADGPASHTLGGASNCMVLGVGMSGLGAAGTGSGEMMAGPSMPRTGQAMPAAGSLPLRSVGYQGMGGAAKPTVGHPMAMSAGTGVATTTPSTPAVGGSAVSLAMPAVGSTLGAPAIGSVALGGAGVVGDIAHAPPLGDQSVQPPAILVAASAPAASAGQDGGSLTDADAFAGLGDMASSGPPRPLPPASQQAPQTMGASLPFASAQTMGGMQPAAGTAPMGGTAAVAPRPLGMLALEEQGVSQHQQQAMAIHGAMGAPQMGVMAAKAVGATPPQQLVAGVQAVPALWPTLLRALADAIEAVPGAVESRPEGVRARHA